MEQTLPTFREKEYVHTLLDAIRRRTTRPYGIMEICGGQTHAIAKYRLEELLPDHIRLIHGPGCPVCVTPENIVAQAIAIARLPNVIFTSFGDMLRVPGGDSSLMSARAAGADVRMVYSPLDAVKLAVDNPDKDVVFFGIGFETTAPVHALAIQQAARLRLSNFSILSSLVLVPPALKLLMDDPDNRIDALLAAGHVCAVTGYDDYITLAVSNNLPVSVTGFEPADILWGIYNCIDQLEKKEYSVRNAYARVVQPAGNPKAMQAVGTVFERCDREWRGLGMIPESGLRIRKDYELYDTSLRFKINTKNSVSVNICRSGEVLRGKIHPFECPAFGKECIPEHPLGAAMVSSEGACAAFYRYNPLKK
ncbi:MAG: hydrogenase formation protein HypD [Bacteroidales bacterium]